MAEPIQAESPQQVAMQALQDLKESFDILDGYFDVLARERLSKPGRIACDRGRAGLRQLRGILMPELQSAALAASDVSESH